MRPARTALTYAVSTACPQDTLGNWKAAFGGMAVSAAQRLKALEDENTRLKKPLAEQMLDLAAMKDLVSEKMAVPP